MELKNDESTNSPESLEQLGQRFKHWRETRLWRSQKLTHLCSWKLTRQSCLGWI